jgi:hypothetical protein
MKTLGLSALHPLISTFYFFFAAFIVNMLRRGRGNEPVLKQQGHTCLYCSILQPNQLQPHIID